MVIHACQWQFLILHALLIVLAWPGCMHMVRAVETVATTEKPALAVSKSSLLQRGLLENSQKTFFPPTCIFDFTCSLLTPATPKCCLPPPNGLFLSLGSCVNLFFDPQNCGSCANDCTRQGLPNCCLGSCANVFSDPRNCGSCGNDCTKQGLYSCCLGKCVNYANDINNCGGCGIKCPSGGLYNCCSGKCVNILYDDNNCGGCGNKCGPCSANSTQTFIPGGLTNYICCTGKCVDIFNDRNNCGSCGLVITQLPFNYLCYYGQPIFL